MKPRRTIEEVLEQVRTTLPQLEPHMVVERAWLWYAGPSLQHEPATRAALKALGFRYARLGHQLPDGRIGTWANSCLAPTPHQRSKTVKDKRDLTDAELLAALEAA